MAETDCLNVSNGTPRKLLPAHIKWILGDWRFDSLPWRSSWVWSQDWPTRSDHPIPRLGGSSCLEKGWVHDSRIWADQKMGRKQFKMIFTALEMDHKQLDDLRSPQFLGTPILPQEPLMKVSTFSCSCSNKNTKKYLLCLALTHSYWCQKWLKVFQARRKKDAILSYNASP